ncbi:MAG TPA: hypothetical protein VKS81_01875 [Bacteroidota bacterium]|nr:hypothetical protein [Bacteroidota bacterium]
MRERFSLLTAIIACLLIGTVSFASACGNKSTAQNCSKTSCANSKTTASNVKDAKSCPYLSGTCTQGSCTKGTKTALLHKKTTGAKTATTLKTSTKSKTATTTVTGTN